MARSSASARVAASRRTDLRVARGPGRTPGDRPRAAPAHAATDPGAHIGSASLGQGVHMVKLVVSYGAPDDPAAFDQHYASTHIPLVQKIPNLRRFEAGK